MAVIAFHISGSCLIRSWHNKMANFLISIFEYKYMLDNKQREQLTCNLVKLKKLRFFRSDKPSLIECVLFAMYD